VFPVIDVAAAAVEASLLAASSLQSMRTGATPAAVELDAAHLACAVRSERYLQLDGRPYVSSFAPLSRFLPTTDGWIRLHANYPWHRQRLLRVLGTAAEPESVAAAVARLRAVDLEDAIVDAGGCAAAVRRPEEWLAHPQGAAVSELPLLELLPGGDAAPGLPPPGLRPASGVRVLDLTRVIAGPVCTRTLAAHGADVLRIDSPELPETSEHALDTTSGKRSTLLDLRRPVDRQRFETLLSDAHVVVQGYRPGALAALGLSPHDLIGRHPGLIVLSLSAWSHSGAWAERRGFDSLVQAASGIALREAAGDPTPGVLPAQLLDHATGYLGAAAVLTALGRHQLQGGSWHARLSLAQTAAWVLRQPLQPKPTRLDEIDPAPCLVQLSGPPSQGVVTLVTPPGRLGGRALTWPSPPPRYGADPAEWVDVPLSTIPTGPTER
jgi:crotonobetainyl-CoA:carnitine CoA-transferase CaiB-like acyl-CoA transferase